MTSWEYLFLQVEGHRSRLNDAQNMLVTTSDGRWNGTKMPTNVVSVVNELGAEGWEMVNSSAYSSSGSGISVVVPSLDFSAVFKRPRP